MGEMNIYKELRLPLQQEAIANHLIKKINSLTGRKSSNRKELIMKMDMREFVGDIGRGHVACSDWRRTA